MFGLSTDGKKGKRLKSTFRGVPFLFETTDDELGHEYVVHEFAGRDDAYAEPMGIRTRRFTVEAILIGKDYRAQLAKLEEALEKPGAAKLYHPFRGDKFCAVDGPVQVRHSTREGGMARVRITFVESGPPLAPVAKPDTAGKVKAASKNLLEKAAGMASKLDLSGPDFLTDAVNDVLAGPRGLTNAMERTRAGIQSKFGLIDDVARAIDDFGAAIDGLLGLPGNLMDSIQNLINSIFTAVNRLAPGDPSRGDESRDRARVAAAVSFMTSMGTFGSTLPAVPTTTNTRRKQKANQDLIADVVDTAGFAEGVNALTDIPLDNADQADQVLRAVSDIVDAIELRGSIDDDVALALRSLRTAFFDHMRRRTVDLTGLGTYVPPGTTSALELSWLLYGDAIKADDIAFRNGVEHPAFLHGSVPLFVQAPTSAQV